MKMVHRDFETNKSNYTMLGFELIRKDEANMKNVNAINKIIAELAMKDYLAANPRKANGRPKYKTYHPYSLSPETNEAREIKLKYLSDEITEEEYKAFCLKYNLTH